MAANSALQNNMLVAPASDSPLETHLQARIAAAQAIYDNAITAKNEQQSQCPLTCVILMRGTIWKPSSDPAQDSAWCRGRSLAQKEVDRTYYELKEAKRAFYHAQKQIAAEKKAARTARAEAQRMAGRKQQLAGGASDEGGVDLGKGRKRSVVQMQDEDVVMTGTGEEGKLDNDDGTKGLPLRIKKETDNAHLRKKRDI